MVSSDREITSYAARKGKATLSSIEFESIVNRQLTASNVDFQEEKDTDEEEYGRPAGKKGPARRLSKAKRQAQTKIRKLY